MINQPIPVTAAEFNEIAASPELQDLWGVENAEEMARLLKTEYLTRFNFATTQTPVYTGDLFVIQSDYLDPDVPAIRMIRGAGGQLVILR